MVEGKTTWRYFLILATLFFVPFLVHADERIEDFSVSIEVDEDASISVFETIRYNFGDTTRHGIYRDIPYSYETDFGTRRVGIEVTSVSKDGFEEPFTTSNSGGNKRVRIGDPDMYVEGVHTYRIHYIVKGALNAFSDYDELYWNAIGHDWGIPIEKGHVEVYGIENIEQTRCYYGTYNSRAQCVLTPTIDSKYQVSLNDLVSGEGITVAIGYTKGQIQFPSIWQKLWWWLIANPFILLPLLVFAIMYRFWYERGRDAKGRGVIVPQYTPPIAINPLFMGSIVDGYLDNHDITAGIIYLAEQGMLNIIKEEEKKFLGTETDYKLIWRGDYKELSKKDQMLVKLLFGEFVVKGEEVELSQLKTDKGMQKRRRALQKHIDEELVRSGYFANKPHATRRRYTVLAGVALVIAISLWSFDAVFGLSIMSSIAVVGVFGFLMPKRTRSGAEMREYILGFKDFLSVTEKERLKFHNAPEKTPTEFMENLPFAIALEVDEQWAKQFEDIHITQPSWYKAPVGSTFNARVLTSDLSQLHASVDASVNAASGGSGSTGGGFSGGGMGGGGGGSW